MLLPRYLSFSSAGTKGLAFAGVLDALEMSIESFTSQTFDDWRRSLRGVAGTSAGSIAALTLALGMPRDLRQEVLTTELSDVHNLIRCPDVSLLLGRFGVEDGQAFKQAIKNVLARGGLSSTSTMSDLRRLLQIDIIFITSELNCQKPIHLSAATVPHMLVCDAIFASCCMPFVFAPFEFGGSMFIDGSLTCSLPDVFDRGEETLFVYVPFGSFVRKPRNWHEYIQRIMSCTTYPQKTHYEEIHGRGPWTVEISNLQHVDTFLMDIDTDTREKYHWYGFVSTLDTLTKCAIGISLTGYLFRLVTYCVHSLAFVRSITAIPSFPESGSESEGDQYS